MRQLEIVFDTVRLVDPAACRQFFVGPAGKLVGQADRCYKVWNKTGRCENCVSAKAFMRKNRMTKFEFAGSEVYHVMAQYMEVEERPYVLEMVCHINDEALFGAYGKSDFARTISYFNHKLYTDPLTGVYNRRYYEDQLAGLAGQYAVAMLDVDNFKEVNDTYGHPAGDLALRAVASALTFCTGETGIVVRYGGDEFLIFFERSSPADFGGKLEQIRRAVSDMLPDKWARLRLSVSIGGVYRPACLQNALAEADRMLYKAKAAKDSVQWR